MSVMESQITGVSIVYSTVCSGQDQRKHQSSASLAFVKGIHRCPVNSQHKGPETLKMFLFDDVIIDTTTSWSPFLVGANHPFTLHTQQRGCWWHFDAKGQGISNHDIDINNIFVILISIPSSAVCQIIHLNKIKLKYNIEMKSNSLWNRQFVKEFFLNVDRECFVWNCASDKCTALGITQRPVAQIPQCPSPISHNAQFL